MNDSSFWQRILYDRLSRRRLLSRGGAMGLGAAALSLLGCGPSRKEGGVSGTSPLSTPTDTTASARAGGTFRSYLPVDVPSFDPLASNSSNTHTQVAAYTYPRLLKFVPGVFPKPSVGNVEGDLVESYELSADRLSITLRLRQGLKWDGRAPTNGRAIDAQDVLFSWSKFSRTSPFRNDLAYVIDQSPGAPIDTLTSPDPRTVVLKMKQPEASVFGLLASDRLLYVMPRESEGGYDPRIDIRGYGPWLIADNKPGISRSWTKNADYYVKGRPFPDRLEQAIVPDYNARLAQFKAGLIWNSVASQDDILPTKRQTPALVLGKADAFSTQASSLAFGYDGDSPWKDDRLRQAVSLLIDRETMIDLKTNRPKYAAEGLQVDIRYHSAVAAGWEGYWVDPQDEANFGPNARYFKYDPAEAHRLMSAAGYPDGVDTLLHYNGGNEYAPSYTRTAELVSGMLHEGGVHARLDPHDYQNDWLPNYNYAYTASANIGKPIKGFPGIIFRVFPGSPVLQSQLLSIYHRNGTRFIGMTPDGKNAVMGDPDANKMIETLRQEFDQKRQQELSLDFARFMARKTYDIPMPAYAALGFNLSWPVIGNLGTFRGWPGGSAVTETALNQWIDTSKAPLSQTT